MKKIAIIGTAGIPAKYGGFETLVDHLTNELKSDYKFIVYCSSKLYPKKERTSIHENIRLKYIPLSANGKSSILYDLISIIHALFVADSLLILGVSGCIALPFIKFFSSKKIIINIDGMEWKRGKWNGIARYFLKYSEKLALKYGDEIITDNQGIADYAKKEYNRLTHVISYGGNHVKKINHSISDYVKYPFLTHKYYFKVARIEPENNIHVILKVFSKTNEKIVIVGNWNNSEYGKHLFDKYNLTSNIYLLQPIYEQNQLDLLRSNCDIYIHGHSAGGTNPSLVEAMNLGLPILSFDVNFNRYTTQNQAIFFKKEVDLLQIINNIQNYDIDALKIKSSQIAQEKYLWSKIANDYSILFKLNTVNSTKSIFQISTLKS